MSPRQAQSSLWVRHPFIYATRWCLPNRGSGSEQDIAALKLFGTIAAIAAVVAGLTALARRRAYQQFGAAHAAATTAWSQAMFCTHCAATWVPGDPRTIGAGPRARPGPAPAGQGQSGAGREGRQVRGQLTFSGGTAAPARRPDDVLPLGVGKPGEAGLQDEPGEQRVGPARRPGGEGLDGYVDRRRKRPVQAAQLGDVGALLPLLAAPVCTRAVTAPSTVSVAVAA